MHFSVTAYLLSLADADRNALSIWQYSRTDEMLRLRAFRVQQKETGSASLQAKDAQPLTAISEFGAKP